MQENTLELIKYMEGFVSERRRYRLQEVLAERTRHIMQVLFCAAAIASACRMYISLRTEINSRSVKTYQWAQRNG